MTDFFAFHQVLLQLASLVASFLLRDDICYPWGVKIRPELLLVCCLGGCPSKGSVTTSLTISDTGSSSTSSSTSTSSSGGSDTASEPSLTMGSGTASTSTTLGETTAGDGVCPECSDCSDQETCVARCKTGQNPADRECYVECIEKVPFSSKLEACEYEDSLCGPDMTINGFGEDYFACGDVLCSDACDICSVCDWYECELTNPCKEGYNCSPIRVFSEHAYDWLACLPSGDLPVDSPCVEHSDFDECEYGAACVVGVCRFFCDEDDSCPQGYHCETLQNWVNFCVLD